MNTAEPATTPPTGKPTREPLTPRLKLTLRRSQLTWHDAGDRYQTAASRRRVAPGAESAHYRLRPVTGSRRWSMSLVQRGGPVHGVGDVGLGTHPDKQWARAYAAHWEEHGTAPAPIALTQPLPDDQRPAVTAPVTHTPDVPLVRFTPGDGRGPILLAVAELRPDGRAVGPDGACAFCQDDPTAEHSGPETLIGDYMIVNPWAETCPLCKGQRH